MMNIWKFFCAAVFAVLICSAVPAADSLAVAEPVNKGGVEAKDIEAVWSMLEGSVDGGYNLISRAALKQMLTEIGLTDSSGLVNLNAAQKAKLGEVKTVKYLLVPTLGKFGSRLTLTLLIVDSSTGEIDPERKVTETYQSLDDLADRLKDTLNGIGLGMAAKTYGKSALLTPVIRSAAGSAPAGFVEDFNIGMEEALLDGGVRLLNLQSVSKILKNNKIDNLYEVEPAMYVRIGSLLRVDYLIQATITRFSCEKKTVEVEVTRTTVTRYLGNIDGSIRVISAQTGDVAASFRFSTRVDFSDLDDSIDTDDWTSRDYARYLIDASLKSLPPKILKTVKPGKTSSN